MKKIFLFTCLIAPAALCQPKAESADPVSDIRVLADGMPGAFYAKASKGIGSSNRGQGYDALTTVTIPPGTVKAGYGAFKGCDNLGPAPRSESAARFGNNIFR
jgi:hypothetical protein